MFFKKSIISVLILSLMVSTMGLTINKLYCICVDELETSFFEIEDGCHQAEKSLCKNDKKSCCASSKHDKKPCAEKDAQYFKLNTEFERPDGQSFPLIAVNPSAIALAVALPIEKKSQIKPAISYEVHAPPLFLLHNVFRC